MPKNEDGEFELILGNRQLLSVFFIVVILLGVFFTMGYIVGRNSGTLTADVAATPAPDSQTASRGTARKNLRTRAGPARRPRKPLPSNPRKKPQPRPSPHRASRSPKRSKQNRSAAQAAIPPPDRPICN